MVLTVAKYALVGYAVIKAGRFVVRKVADWRGTNEQ